MIGKVPGMLDPEWPGELARWILNGRGEPACWIISALNGQGVPGMLDYIGTDFSAGLHPNFALA